MNVLAPLRRLRRLFSGSGEDDRFGAESIVLAVEDLAAALHPRSDGELRVQADSLREQVRRGQSCLAPDIAAPGLALVVEATRRARGCLLFHAQVLAGLALARGAVAEMATGEGKTLAAALPAFLHSLGGEGVHVATPNAYLANRDFEEVSAILRLLGTSVGLVPESAPDDLKRAAYQCDVTYATGYELGFDYLRDQVRAINAPRPALGQATFGRLRRETPLATPPVQARHHLAIIDEIDSVLIDEACLPLILSATAETTNRFTAAYQESSRIAQTLRAGDDYHVDAVARQVRLTSACQARIYDDYQQRLRLELQRPWAQYVEQALAARACYGRDVDYVVRDGRVLLVDEFTGRIFRERMWRDGLHQAIEAKEGLLPSCPCATTARISRQRYFQLYRRLCGMTATAMPSRLELWQQYRLRVEKIPLQNPCRRVVLPTRFFRDAAAKQRALVDEVIEVHRTGRPVLVGTRTIENSQIVARLLQSAGVPCQLLNGVQDRQEAQIIADAGERDAVTIATNMAGRGTDIRLGPGVAELGGLHVIGAEVHPAGRIDRQLLGRAARQGDPGSGRFFVSADDALLCREGAGLRRRMQTLPHVEGELQADLSRELAAVQRKAEAAARRQRRQMTAVDDWLDELRVALGELPDR